MHMTLSRLSVGTGGDRERWGGRDMNLGENVGGEEKKLQERERGVLLIETHCMHA